MSCSALDFIKSQGLVVASDGAEFLKIAEFDPIDATSNPSLVYAAVTKPDYTHILHDAVQYAHRTLPAATLDQRADLAMDRLLVEIGIQILHIIPGRVSLSIDPRLGYSRDGIVDKALALIHLFEEVAPREYDPRRRVLLKIPATAQGIHAAWILEHKYALCTNMTLVFGTVQAIACAQAGLKVISPFIGRVKDWYRAKGKLDDDTPLEHHPGIRLVRDIRASYTHYGYQTEVMAAGFRSVDEIVEVAKGGRSLGPHLVTLPPELLDGLRRSQAPADAALVLQAPEVPPTPPIYFSADGPTEVNLRTFERDSAAECISLDKVPEGLDKFSVDAIRLEEAVKAALRDLESKRARSHRRVESATYRSEVEVK